MMNGLRFRAHDMNGNIVFWEPKYGDNGFWEMVRAGILFDVEQAVGKAVDKGGQRIFEGDRIEVRFYNNPLVRGTVRWFDAHSFFGIEEDGGSILAVNYGGSAVEGIYIINKNRERTDESP
jgi:hypothetical protein